MLPTAFVQIDDRRGARSPDPLTGLPIRSDFLEHARRALAAERPTGWATVVFAIDLDHFHRVNDEHGHDGGDRVLVTVADRLHTLLRRHDTIVGGASAITRLGGDEFLLMFERVPDEAAALVIATSLMETVARPLALGARKVVVTASVGIAFSTSGSDPQQMVLQAEAAKRHAKECGRARHQLFTTEYSERSTAESTLVEALHNAVGAGEFRLLYQPKISLATRRITGVEALLRWEHPERGLIAPGEFIAAAERSGAIVPIGAWVLKESLRQAAVWQQAYPTTPLRVAINVSARQLSTELGRTVSDRMNEVGIRPDAVCLEVTETMLMDNIDQTIEILDELKALGLTVSIDDFGTGYSSLEYLHRMPIDEVKIDQSFVAGLGSDAVNTAIVASVISLAHAMHLEVVAEGVETSEQLERLHNLGCDFAEGYFIARPMPASEIDECLAANATGQQFPRADPTGGAARSALSETVLVVDDAADVRMLATMSLTAAGFTVEEAGNGAAAVALARRFVPRCVLLDVSLPDMSGIAVCKALRDDVLTAGCTIVMVTTHADSADKAEAFLVGADDYIVKPFTPRELVAVCPFRPAATAVHRRQACRHRPDGTAAHRTRARTRRRLRGRRGAAVDPTDRDPQTTPRWRPRAGDRSGALSQPEHGANPSQRDLPAARRPLAGGAPQLAPNQKRERALAQLNLCYRPSGPPTAERGCTELGAAGSEAGRCDLDDVVRRAAEDADSELAVGERGLDAAAEALRQIDLALVAAVLPLVDEVLLRRRAAESGEEAQRAGSELDRHVIGLHGRHRAHDDERASGLVHVDGHTLGLHRPLGVGRRFDDRVMAGLLGRHRGHATPGPPIRKSFRNAPVRTSPATDSATSRRALRSSSSSHVMRETPTVEGFGAGSRS